LQNPFPTRPRIGKIRAALFIVVIPGAHAESPARRVCARGLDFRVLHPVSNRPRGAACGFAVLFCVNYAVLQRFERGSSGPLYFPLNRVNRVNFPRFPLLREPGGI
jgi:hypothetical protein